MDGVTWREFWPAVGAIATLGVGAAPVIVFWPHAGLVPLAGVIVAILLLGLLAMTATGQLVHRTKPFYGLPESRRTHIATLIRVAIGAHVAWALTWQLRPEWWPVMPLVLLGLSGVEWAYAVTHDALAKLPPKPDPAPAEVKAVELDDTSLYWLEALRRCDLGSLAFDGWEPNVDEESGDVFGADFMVDIPSKATQRGQV
jgi:hypothetical protein